jgi:hypothetical protein
MFDASSTHTSAEESAPAPLLVLSSCSAADHLEAIPARLLPNNICGAGLAELAEIATGFAAETSGEACAVQCARFRARFANDDATKASHSRPSGQPLTGVR